MVQSKAGGIMLLENGPCAEIPRIDGTGTSRQACYPPIHTQISNLQNSSPDPRLQKGKADSNLAPLRISPCKADRDHPWLHRRLTCCPLSILQPLRRPAQAMSHENRQAATMGYPDEHPLARGHQCITRNNPISSAGITYSVVITICTLIPAS